MIEVITERRLLPEEMNDMVRLFSEEARRARSAGGCFSAEILQSTDDPWVWLSRTTWASGDHWKSWKASPSCDEIEGEIKSRLLAPEKESVFTCIR
jgi:heme-degrading monooxygenase HmoA